MISKPQIITTNDGIYAMTAEFSNDCDHQSTTTYFFSD